jgi:hypothetical protein
MATHTRSRDLRARSAAIVDHHYDTENPHKPLWLLIPSGLVALFMLACAIATAYSVWYKGDMKVSEGEGVIAVLMVFYLCAVFVFSYGYELYNVPRALRDTAIIGLAGVFILVILIVVFKAKDYRLLYFLFSFSTSCSKLISRNASGSRGAFSFPSSRKISRNDRTALAVK